MSTTQVPVGGDSDMPNNEREENVRKALQGRVDLHGVCKHLCPFVVNLVVPESAHGGNEDDHRLAHRDEAA